MLCTCGATHAMILPDSVSYMYRAHTHVFIICGANTTRGQPWIRVLPNPHKISAIESNTPPSHCDHRAGEGTNAGG
eukprot:1679160-Lingulodinium_polyedra.AAC.1